MHAMSAAVGVVTNPMAAAPVLGRMVLIGHSQGGLLVKLMTIETGDKVWNALSDRPIDSLRSAASHPAACLPAAAFPPGIHRPRPPDLARCRAAPDQRA
jgi:hypothetical protein